MIRYITDNLETFLIILIKKNLIKTIKKNKFDNDVLF